MVSRTATIRFTSKGQVVIPLWVRKEFEITDGSLAVLSATPEGILLKPITGTAIRRVRGLLKRKGGTGTSAAS